VQQTPPINTPQEHTVKVSRILIVALAVAAIVAPTASARLIDEPQHTVAPVAVPDMRASVAEALAKQREAQSQTRTWPAYPTPEKRLPGPPTWPVNPQPIKPPATAAAPSGGEGIDWWTVALGAGLTLVALGAMGGLTYLVRAKQRPRVA
jgi:hypothetical protein